MPTIKVDHLAFSFPTNHAASAYDRWEHYLKVLQPRNLKGVDIVAARVTTKPPVAWLLEVKDFRFLRAEPGEKNLGNLPQTVVAKAADTLTGLAHAATGAAIPEERQQAQRLSIAGERRVVLHLEPHPAPPPFVRVPNAANVAQKIRQLLREAGHGITGQPLVLNRANTARARMPWTVSVLGIE